MPLALATVKSAPPQAWPLSGLLAIGGGDAVRLPSRSELGKQLLKRMIWLGPAGLRASRE